MCHLDLTGPDKVENVVESLLNTTSHGNHAMVT